MNAGRFHIVFVSSSPDKPQQLSETIELSPDARQGKYFLFCLLSCYAYGNRKIYGEENSLWRHYYYVSTL